MFGVFAFRIYSNLFFFSFTASLDALLRVCSLVGDSNLGEFSQCELISLLPALKV